MVTVGQTLAPGLLIAMPQLEDPNFERSVVLMVSHDHNGSFGLVINREIDLNVGEVLEPLGIDWNGDPETAVHWGGPVTPESGWLLYAPDDEGAVEGTIEVTDGVLLSSTEERLRALARRPPSAMRFLLGYAGWGPGQLELELAQGAWVVAAAAPELVFYDDADAIWVAALRSIGVDPATLVQGFGVH